MGSPARLNFLLLFVAALLGSALQLAPASGLAYELNTDRPGGDFTSADVPGNDPRLCASRCEIEGQCLAWSYNLPGVQGPAARCWLKNSLPAAVADNNAVSDIRPFEYGIDRPGSDYTSFDLQFASPAQCAARCSGEAQCQAWTYVQPGVQGTLARCWLKNAVPPVTAATFAVSGVRSFEYDTDRPGGDYSSSDLPNADPQLCAARCAGDTQCQAWTYVIPGVQASSARCWLKNSVPVSAARDFTVSGVRAFEYDIDRPGDDYSDVALEAPDPQLCAARCAGDSQCAAWTYKKPGSNVDGLAHCSLKNSASPQVPSVFAVSGLRPGTPPPPQCNYAGAWQTETGTLTLTQTGNRVSGTYTASGGGTIDGTVSADCTWQGNWANNDGVRRGTFSVKLSPDGQMFSGTETPEGLAPTPVTARRIDAPPAPTGQCPNPPNFAGRWNDPVSLGNVELAQAGNRVSGTYTGGDGGGTLDGTIAGCVWQGEWINVDTVRRGTFRVDLSQDGQAFNGTWETTGAGGNIKATR